MRFTSLATFFVFFKSTKLTIWKVAVLLKLLSKNSLFLKKDTYFWPLKEDLQSLTEKFNQSINKDKLSQHSLDGIFLLFIFHLNLESGVNKTMYFRYSKK